MKKYTSQEINRLSWQEWNELMADELNNAGYKSRPGTQWEHSYEAGDEPEFFILGEVSGRDEINYLKDIGLLNNGRCPMCGKPIYSNPGRFTEGSDHECHFQICQNCASTRGGMIKPNQPHGGCLIALLLFPLALIRGIIG